MPAPNSTTTAIPATATAAVVDATALPAPVTDTGEVLPVASAVSPTPSSAAAIATAPTSVVATTSDASTAASAPTTNVAAAQRQATVMHTGKPATFGQPVDGPGIGGTVFALVLVVALILGLGWLARRMPGVGRASNASLRMVGSLALGPRERVVVVEVGATQLLLGVGPGGISTLHTLSEPLPAAVPASAATPFAQLLAQQFGKKP